MDFTETNQAQYFFKENYEDLNTIDLERKIYKTTISTKGLRKYYCHVCRYST
jgi:hypothetical protein